MFRITTSIMLFSTLSSAYAGPFPLPVASPLPAVPLTSSILPITYPLLPTPRPLVPGLPGYNNNPYYNQYRTPGVAVPILTYTSDHNGDGSYYFSFTTADGKQAQESGYLKDAYIDNAGEPQGTQVVQGSYAYISPEGTPIQVTYVADENGFRPSGVHIPGDGKAVVPLIGDKENLTLDPRLNRLDPYYRNRSVYQGRLNSARPYDPRYPYEATKLTSNYNNHNPYLPPSLNPGVGVTDLAKKSSG